MKKQDTQEFTAKPSKSKKKIYRRPEVKMYGDIRSITHGGASSTMSDSGSNMMSPP
jgi:hypothetical protein